MSWLFGIVRISGTMEAGGEPVFRVSLFGKTVMGGEEKTEKKPKKQKKRKKKPPEAVVTAEKTEEVQKNRPPSAAELLKEAPEEKPEAEAPPLKTEEKPEEKPRTIPAEKKKEMRRVRLSELSEEPPEEPSFAETGEEDFLEDESFFTGESKALAEEETQTKKAAGKLDALKNKLKKLNEYFPKEDRKEIFEALKQLLKRLMKGILPKDLYLAGTFGTGDPASTGCLLGVFGVMKAKFGDRIQIKGDFSKMTAEDITVRVQGKIVLGTLLFAAAAFVLKKPVRTLLLKLWKGTR